MERVKNFIHGEWVDSKSGETFSSINPANKDEVIGIISRSGREDVDEAVRQHGKPMREGVIRELFIFIFHVTF